MKLKARLIEHGAWEELVNLGKQGKLWDFGEESLGEMEKEELLAVIVILGRSDHVFQKRMESILRPVDSKSLHDNTFINNEKKIPEHC